MSAGPTSAGGTTSDGTDDGNDPTKQASDESTTERVFDWTRFTLSAGGPATYHRQVDDCDAGGGSVMQVEETLTIRRAVTDYEDFKTLTKSRSTRPHSNNPDPVVEYLLPSKDNHAMCDDGSSWTVTVAGSVEDWLALYETVESMHQYSRSDIETELFASKAEYQYLAKAKGASLLNTVLRCGAVAPNCAIALVAIYTESDNPENHEFEQADFQPVEYDDGTARGFCSDGCRSWVEHHEQLEPIDENDAHHLWTGRPDSWRQAL